MLQKLRNLKVIMVFIVIAVLCVTLPFFIKRFSKPIYSVDSRIGELNQEKKKDQSDKYKTIGWLRVQGTNIDTPIITFYDDDMDEEITVDKENYLWNEINKEKLFNKVNIMGHNILNLSSNPASGLENFTRFDDLMSFVYLDFVKDNKYIQYTVDGKDYIYKIFAVNFDYQDRLNLYYDGNYSKSELKKYINSALKNSIFKFNVSVDENDKVISLVTCTRMFGYDDQKDFIVNARLVREGERLSNYNVRETKNYNKIKSLMKGVESNEKA